MDDGLTLRERLRGLLMTAMYRCGRVAEALEAYRQAWNVIVADLGIEPSEQLQQLEYAILTSDPALDPPQSSANLKLSHRAVPNLLPADIADFTGREEQSNHIRKHLVDNGDADRRPVPVVVLMGQGGIGKTTLAVHAAHGLTSHSAMACYLPTCMAAAHIR